ncbi:hypothetical protein Ancab_019111 [Ancistrocladus abbreviatus]
MNFFSNKFQSKLPPKAAKSKEAPAERDILGRFSPHLKIGLVGLPNLGKSTLFNILTKLSIPAENFPIVPLSPVKLGLVFLMSNLNDFVSYTNPRAKFVELSLRILKLWPIPASFHFVINYSLISGQSI